MPVASKPVRQKVRADGTIDLYGLSVPATAPRIAVELQCYRENAQLKAMGLPVESAEEHFRRAWRIMWPKYEWSEWVELLIHAWCNFKWVVVIGHQRASKSYTMAHICWLDYCADPTQTLVTMGTVTLQGLRIRMWSDMQHAAESAEIKFPIDIRTSTNELRAFPFESAKEAAEKFQIMGMALNQSKDAPGKIRGGHAPRRRLFLDEAENIAPPIYEAMGNPMSAPDSKAALLTNPMLKLSNLGRIAEPIGGWSSVHDTDLFWRLKKYEDGICIHLDGRQSPNVKAKSRKFTGLLIQEDIDEIVRAHGPNSLQYWSLIVGFPPPDGVVANIFPASVLERGSHALRFNFRPQMCATLDPAFEQDASVLTIGELGRLPDGRMAINAVESITFKYAIGEEAEPKDYQCAHQVMEHCARHGVQPSRFIMDKSGGGRGAFAILQKEWSRDIQGIEYAGAATERSLRQGGDLIANQTVEKFVSELWFRARYYMEDGVLGGLAALDPRTLDDLSGRIYTLKELTDGKRMVAEKKDDYKIRLGRSCDWGDSFCGFSELMVRLGVTPGNGGMAPGGDRWAAARKNARKASEAYADEKAYAN